MASAEPPNITSWQNTETNDQSLDFKVIDKTVNFNVSVDMTVDQYNWTYDDNKQVDCIDNCSITFSSFGQHYINVSVINNSAGTDNKSWAAFVEPRTIDVTLSNIPILFGSVFSGSLNPSPSPLNVTIHNTTNVNVNITLNSSDFRYGYLSFGSGNMTYSNSSTGIRTSMNAFFYPSTYANWINIEKRVSTNRSIFLWLAIPEGQESGDYSSDVNIRVEEYS